MLVVYERNKAPLSQYEDSTKFSFWYKSDATGHKNRVKLYRTKDVF